MATEVIGRAKVIVTSEVDPSGVRTAGTKMGDLLNKSLKGAAIGAAGAIGAAVGTTLFKGFQRLSAIEDAKAKLKGLGNTANDVAKIMENSLAAVKGTAFGLGDAATVAAQLVAAQAKPGKQLEAQLKTVANLASAAGIGLSEMGSIYAKAMTQANGVQNDVIGQLQDRGLPIYQKLAEQLDVTAGEVFDLAKDGKISFEEFSKAAEAAGGTVADEMGKTVPGSLDNVEAALGRVGAAFLSPGFESAPGALSSITQELDDMVPAAQKAGEFLANVLALGTAPAPAGTGTVLAPGAKPGDVRSPFAEALDAGAEEAAGSWWEKFLLEWQDQGQASLGKTGEEFELLAELWADAADGGIVDSVSGALEDAEAAIKRWFEDTKENVRDGWEDITNIWPEIQAAFEQDMDNLESVFSDGWEAIKIGASGFIEDIKDTASEWKEAGAELVGNFVDGFLDFRGGSRAIGQRIKDAINNALPDTIQFFEGRDGIPTLSVPVPQFAGGARNFSGGLALVGERGPELVGLPAGADVYSNQESRRMVAGSGGSSNFTVNNYGPVSGADILDQWKWANRFAPRFGATTASVV